MPGLYRFVKGKRYSSATSTTVFTFYRKPRPGAITYQAGVDKAELEVNLGVFSCLVRKGQLVGNDSLQLLGRVCFQHRFIVQDHDIDLFISIEYGDVNRCRQTAWKWRGGRGGVRGSRLSPTGCSHRVEKGGRVLVPRHNGRYTLLSTCCTRFCCGGRLDASYPKSLKKTPTLSTSAYEIYSVYVMSKHPLRVPRRWTATVGSPKICRCAHRRWSGVPEAYQSERPLCRRTGRRVISIFQIRPSTVTWVQGWPAVYSRRRKE